MPFLPPNRASETLALRGVHAPSGNPVFCGSPHSSALCEADPNTSESGPAGQKQRLGGHVPGTALSTRSLSTRLFGQPTWGWFRSSGGSSRSSGSLSFSTNAAEGDRLQATDCRLQTAGRQPPAAPITLRIRFRILSTHAVDFQPEPRSRRPFDGTSTGRRDCAGPPVFAG